MKLTSIVDAFQFFQFQFLVSINWGAWISGGDLSHIHVVDAPYEDAMLCEMIAKIDLEVLLADENFMKIFNERLFIYDIKAKKIQRTDLAV